MAFCVILIGLPLTGWAAIATGRAALTPNVAALIGGLSWPLLPGLPHKLHDPMEGAHGLLVKITYALVILHVGAAMKHPLLDRGRLSGRM